MDNITSRARLVFFWIGLGVLLLAGVSAAMNFKNDTLFTVQHGSAVFGLGFVGIVGIFLGTHFKLPTGLVLSPHAQALTAAVEKAAAPLVDAAKSLAETKAKAAIDLVEKAVRDEAGKFGITIPAKQNLEAIYHLAEQAAASTDQNLKEQALKLCRDLNDKLFLLHHNIPAPAPQKVEPKNDPNSPPKNPSVAS